MYVLLAIACQTAGPNGLKFFMDTHGCLGGTYAKKNSKFLFFPRATPGPSASNG